ncbi:TPA: hypothetical protein NPB33_004220 [Salmonella enterica subsp. enterica serovar Kintambo]|nr:fimbrial protein [Salmonella enterica]EBU7006020.1 fimbrial protein [Salmonella enterica subsp. enterica serovar Kintambo]EAY4065300.1 fimbrial protein [Salmonella enterica]EBX6890465.1 fimbrial protein [Salmonella enterica subsp. enterica serovar Kintambo]ECS5446328.1 fimbrial protein [Salmonella enterica subsp. enterica serovar Kintambo]
MKLTSIYSAVALSLLLATGAQAVEKNITVTASIDPTLDMAMADGTALPSNIDMQYNPVSGLQDYTLQTKIFTNATDKNITMRLLAPVTLTNTVNSTQTIPLTVKYNQKEVTVADWSTTVVVTGRHQLKIDVSNQCSIFSAT